MLDFVKLLASSKGVIFFLLGGQLYLCQIGFLCELTRQMMENFRFDFCFMGVVGADLFNNVITTYVPEDGIMKRDAVQKSSQCYLVMESNKFDFKANYVYATFNDIEGVICERELSEEIKKKLEEYQTKII